MWPDFNSSTGQYLFYNADYIPVSHKIKGIFLLQFGLEVMTENKYEIVRYNRAIKLI